MLKPIFGVLGSAGAVSVLCFGIGAWALLTIGETYGKDLDYVE